MVRECPEWFADTFEVATDALVIPQGKWLAATPDLREQLQAKLEGGVPSVAQEQRVMAVLEVLEQYLTTGVMAG